MTSILISGNTELFTADALLCLSEEYKVVVAGKTALKERNKNINIYLTSPEEEQFRQLFDVYSFQAVFYISGYADGGEGLFGEIQQLEKVMLECRRSRVEKLIVLSTIESQNFVIQYGKQGEVLKKDYASSRTFGASQMEEMCRYYAEKTKLCCILLRLPYLADRINDKNFLGQVFHRMYRKDKVMFPYHAQDPLEFLSLNDLTSLLMQIIDETEDESGVYYAGSGYQYTYGDLEELLKLADTDVKVVYENYPFTAEIPSYPLELRRRYGYIPMDNVMEDIGKYYRTFLREVVSRRTGLWGKALGLLERAGKGIFKYIELILVFLFVELISHYTSDSIYFRFVDVRLLFVVVMGTIHGMRLGLLAAALECLVLVRQYAQMGISGTLLFYNIENWIPFVAYLMVGSITGYISNKKNDAIVFQKREYSLLRDKYLFLSDVYHGAVENKGEFKRQILGFQDSFGKIFDAVQKLDSELPESIFFEGLKVLEDILENQTIAIYTLDSWQRFGRLAVCSNRMLTRLTKSVSIDKYQKIYETIHKGQIWKNEQLEPEFPMYACGISSEGKVMMMITIQEASVGQFSMHYMNIFQILCGLVQTSFLRALEYERLAEGEIYYEDTHILKPERFGQLVEVQEDMKEAGVADYVLLRFNSRDTKWMDERMNGLVRATDAVGIDKEGTIYLLLVQMNRENFGIVGRRLDERGLEYEIVEKVG